MEYRTEVISPPPAGATAFFERLNNAGVRYGVFKSSRNTPAGLTGDQDLDILVAREDFRQFCAIASACGGIRSVNHRSLVSPAREDWFIPDFERAKYLHLDVHTSVRLGGKFDKRYSSYAYEDIRRWDWVTFNGCSVPIVSPMDEAAITLSRIAFRARRAASGSWQKLTGDWVREIDDLLFARVETEEKSISHESSRLSFHCRVKKRDGDLWVHCGDLARIRQSVRACCGRPMHSAVFDPIGNTLGSWSYAASRIINRIAPGSTIDRRRPVNGGLIVAVIAPDGMGKSTQVERMYKLFSWKFCCARLYLGTGDGQGWWLRRFIRKIYISRRSRIASVLKNTGEAEGGGTRGLKSWAGSFLLSIWGLLTALERHARVQAARKMADRGFIVLCDRWPQSIQQGFMDGPTRQHHKRVGLLRQWELTLYQRMSQVQPDIAIHLIGDYAISQARKPGELTQIEFDKRISLMQEMQARAPRTHVVDAAKDVDEVSKSLFGLIWNAL